MTQPLYSCVVDDVPALYHQVMVWAWTAIEAGIDPWQLVVHGVEGCDERVRLALERLGARWIAVPRFPYGTAMCNRLTQLDSPVLLAAERVVLTDCDLAWLAPVDPALCEGAPRAKVVDEANPPLHLLAPLFREAGFPGAATSKVSLGDALTFHNNCNGGLICLSGEWLERLREPWPRWLRWVGARAGSLGPYAVHLFQIAFALTMEELSASVGHLPLEANCTTRAATTTGVRLDGQIGALHYHRDFHPDGTLRAAGSPKIDDAITKVNEVIRRRIDGAWWLGQPAVSAREPATVVLEGVHGRFLTLEDDHVTRQLRAFGAHTRNELAMLLGFLRAGDQVIDVGAHIGTFAVPFARAVGETGRVIAIEPSPRPFGMLTANVGRNGVADRVRLHDELIADEVASYRVVEAPGHTSAAYYLMTTAESDIRCRRLDAMATDLRPSRPLRLIKIDVEGMELSVLRSGRGLIEAHRPLLYLEVSPAAAQRHFATAGDLEAFLRGRGYALFRNVGLRNSSHDEYQIARLPTLVSADALFDCLAIPEERLAAEAAANPALAAAAAGIPAAP